MQPGDGQYDNRDGNNHDNASRLMARLHNNHHIGHRLAYYNHNHNHYDYQ